MSDLIKKATDRAPETFVTFGSVLAMILSWEANHSMFWALIHAGCGWGYVIYYHYCIR